MKIKKSEYKLVEVFEDISLEDFIDRLNEATCFLDCHDWDEAEETLSCELDEYEELSSDEKEQVLEKCKKCFISKQEKCKQEEINNLSNRSYIIKALDDYIYDNYDILEPGMIGYSLTGQEILDTILNNVNKLKK